MDQRNRDAGTNEPGWTPPKGSVPPVLAPVGPVTNPLDRWVLWGGLAGAVLVVAIVGWVEPRGQFFFPRCWLREHTGLLCPGCGATRALHALLHGDWRQAWALNPLAVLGLPGVAALGIRHLRGVLTGRWWPNPLGTLWGIGLLVVALGAFGVARNLPFLGFH